VAQGAGNLLPVDGDFKSNEFFFGGIRYEIIADISLIHWEQLTLELVIVLLIMIQSVQSILGKLVN